MKQITGQQYDEERALYNITDANIVDCIFAGEADGESVLKEARNIMVDRCSFSLRYPLWHVLEFTMKDSKMDELTRAAIWYAKNGKIYNSTLSGIKAVRECENIEVANSTIVSPEFGWKSDGIIMRDSTVESEYLFFDSDNVELKNVSMKGKYSFQYMNNLVIEDCILDTKDAFWHSSNVTVRNSLVKGEYLGWFSKNLTLIGCKIIGTQPLCYCDNLVLIDCTMEDCDLSFEYSEVTADIKGHVDSIKNPKSGTITVDSVGEIIEEAPVMPCDGKVVIR